MTPADMIFWYTGAAAWGIVAVLIAIAVIVGLLMSAGWAYRKGKRVAMEKLCIAHLRDLDLTDREVRHAFMGVRWPKDWDKEDMLGKLSAVQKDLRHLSAAKWNRKEYYDRFKAEDLTDQQESRAHAAIKRVLGDSFLDSSERQELVVEVAKALLQPDTEPA